MPDKKITELAENTKLAASDLVHIVDDVQGTPTNKKMTFKRALQSLPANTKIDATKFEANTANVRFTVASTPANSTQQAVHGQFKWDSSYLYLCTSNNVWKRVALSSF